MLEQNPNSQSPIGFAHFDLNTLPPQAAVPFTPPLSVPAPRATSLPPNGPARLSELVSRAESVMAHLEKHLVDERAASERAAKTSSDLDERLRLGVRMLQAFDVQVERGEKAARTAQDAIERADEGLRSASGTTEASMHALAERLAREKLEWVERELSWRFERVKEVEERIEQAANGKLAWLDEELAKRLARIDESCAHAQQIVERSEQALARLGFESANSADDPNGRNTITSTIAKAEQASERAERATAALAGLVSEGQRHLESLVARTGDASQLREALGTLVHELAAAREFVQGDLRRMRDDLGWLVEKGERLGGDLVERADRAASLTDELRVATDATAPVLAEFAAFAPLLSGVDDERLRPLADSIASTVRTELATDMRGFSSALRQLATRADSAFSAIRIDTQTLQGLATNGAHGSSHGGFHRGSHGGDERPRDLARSFAQEVARLGAVGTSADSSTQHDDGARIPEIRIPEIEVTPAAAIAVNRPIELEAITDNA